mgnify:FL=1
MYRVTICQNDDCITYKEEAIDDIAQLMRILLFDDKSINFRVESADE